MNSLMRDRQLESRAMTIRYVFGVALAAAVIAIVPADWKLFTLLVFLFFGVERLLASALDELKAIRKAVYDFQYPCFTQDDIERTTAKARDETEQTHDAFIQWQGRWMERDKPLSDEEVAQSLAERDRVDGEERRADRTWRLANEKVRLNALVRNGTLNRREADRQFHAVLTDMSWMRPTIELEDETPPRH